ncbi:MAG: RT0821/Lpp0805 family surface protein [Kiloniellales bacterium]|nr:RT0821/Lpp0805 family surface protein [Kiloniellales bacterium]
MSERIELDTLVAYADGELSGAEHARVEAEIAADSATAQIVADLQDGKKLLRSAYDDPVILEVPKDLRTSIEGLLAKAPDGRSPGTTGGVTVWSAWFHPTRFAVSFALMLLAAAGGYLLAEWRFEQKLAELDAARAQDLQLLEQAIGQALEKHLSGQVVEWRNPTSGSRGQVVPVRTFRSEQGQWCREYREALISESGEEVRYGIACRNAGGEWRTRLRLLGEG